MNINSKFDIKVTPLLSSQIIAPALPMRLETDKDNIKPLAESISKIGLINPITVKKNGKYYEVVAGFRRFLAMNQLGVDSIPCIVLDDDDINSYSIMTAENFERSDVNTFDEAIYLKKLKDQSRISQKELAKIINRTESYVSERLQILEYPDKLRDALYKNQISFSVARELNRIKDPAVLIQYTIYAIENGCTPEVARKWRKQLESAEPMTSEELAEIASDNYNASQNKITVNSSCKICKDQFDINSLTPIYVCSDCLKEVNKLVI